jgi:NADH:ubiquinone oxidoreductase subunit B-like Fe-S oxidoreductase
MYTRRRGNEENKREGKKEKEKKTKEGSLAEIALCVVAYISTKCVWGLSLVVSCCEGLERTLYSAPRYKQSSEPGSFSL